MIRIRELRLSPDHTEQELEQAIRHALRLKNQPFTYTVRRRSIDARKKPQIWFSYVVDVSAADEKRIWKTGRLKNAELVDEVVYRFPWGICETSSFISSAADQKADRRADQRNDERSTLRPVIVGSGPAGMFCALMLARAGLRPIILERGETVDQRAKTVEQFWKDGKLNPESNVQFGEGGAGTFSDGKLNTQIKDPEGRVRFVLQEFVKAGADPDICVDQKPHIGTDRLREIVRNIREEIEALGGTCLFQTCLTNIRQEKDGTIRIFCQGSDRDSFRCNAADDLPGNPGESTSDESASDEFRSGAPENVHVLRTRALVLAIGHSSRDTLRMLYSRGLSMQAKAFAVGVRVQHPQEWINRAMYGEDCPYELEAAPYKVTRKTSGGRGVYSFCMCPGGYVVNASSEPGRLCVNGMSYSDRGGANANSAIVVTVDPEDYAPEIAQLGQDHFSSEESADRNRKKTEEASVCTPKNENPVHPLAGLYYQEMLESRAFQAGNGRIPVQRLEDFRKNRPGSGPGCVSPQMKGAFTWTNVREIFSPQWSEAFLEGMDGFERIIPGFAHPDVLIAGVESRTSSPVRIRRDETYQSNIPGIFPCGEGAGYAGGIVSAAVDGLRVAEAVCRSLSIKPEPYRSGQK